MVRFVHACRRLGLVAAGAAVVTVAGSLAPAVAMPGSATRAAAPSSSYRVIDLGTLPGASDSTALAMNERGDVVGQSGGRAVLWRNGRIVDLGTPAGSFSSAVDINEHGDVVGYSLIGGTYQAFLWRRGRLVDLRALPGDQWSIPNAINDRGEIVGYSNEPTLRAELWRPDGTPVDLTAATGLLQVNDLDNSGRLVGEVAPAGMNTIPVLWSRGQTTVLTDRSGSASAMNDRGEVTGYDRTYARAG